jgi:hypothetical protein
MIKAVGHYGTTKENSSTLSYILLELDVSGVIFLMISLLGQQYINSFKDGRH